MTLKNVFVFFLVATDFLVGFLGICLSPAVRVEVSVLEYLVYGVVQFLTVVKFFCEQLLFCDVC